MIVRGGMAYSRPRLNIRAQKRFMKIHQMACIDMRTRNNRGILEDSSNCRADTTRVGALPRHRGSKLYICAIHTQGKMLQPKRTRQDAALKALRAELAYGNCHLSESGCDLDEMPEATN